MTAPGWYPDPSDPSRQRYFDGKAWTENYAPFGAPAPAVGQPAKPGMSRGMKIGLGVGAAALALIALGSIGNSDKTSSSSSTTVTVTRTVDVTPTTTKPPRTGPMTTIDDDGTYLVGKDIVPGQYRSAGGSGDRSDCYWERLSGLGGRNADIIANEGAEGQRIVEILPTDVAFQTKHCQPWEKIG
jgi:hypothetical protein